MQFDAPKQKRKGEGVGRPGKSLFLVVLVFVFLFAGVGLSFGQGGPVAENPAVSLRAKYAALQDRLGRNNFQRPLYLDSNENTDDLQGEIHAVMAYPFVTAASVLKEAPAWCDILSLHLNVKYCRAQTGKSQRNLSVYIGRKYEQPLEKASPVAFTFRADTSVPDHLRVVLNAENGPFNTRDYRIVLEAIPVEKERTFIRLSYSYGTSLMAKLAMQCYLNTLGSDKVGFTVIGRKDDGRPIYTAEMRGVLERNTMRYYLAVEAYLGALSSPADRRLDVRLQNWFTATEHYPLQLHEMERAEYLTMKHREYQRQVSGVNTAITAQ